MYHIWQQECTTNNPKGHAAEYQDGRIDMVFLGFFRGRCFREFTLAFQYHSRLLLFLDLKCPQRVSKAPDSGAIFGFYW